MLKRLQVIANKDPVQLLGADAGLFILCAWDEGLAGVHGLPPHSSTLFAHFVFPLRTRHKTVLSS